MIDSPNLQRLTLTNPLLLCTIPERFKWFPILEFLKLCPPLPILQHLRLDYSKTVGNPLPELVEALKTHLTKFPKLSTIEIVRHSDTMEKKALVDSTYSNLSPSVLVRLVS